MKKISVAMFVLLTVAACSTGPKRTVLERTEGTSSRPDWVEEMSQTGFKEVDGRMQMIGASEVAGSDSRIACQRSADHSGRVALSSSLSSRVSGLVQQSLGKSSTEFNETTKNYFEAALPNVRVEKQYYERAVTQISEHDKEDKLRCYSLVSIDSKQYAKILSDLASNSEDGQIKETMKTEASRFLASDPKKSVPKEQPKTE